MSVSRRIVQPDEHLPHCRHEAMFSLPSGSLWVLWYDDGELYFPGETPPSITVEIPFDAARALVTRTPAQIGMESPEIQTLVSTNGILSVTLDSTPIFIEAGS